MRVTASNSFNPCLDYFTLSAATVSAQQVSAQQESATCTVSAATESVASAAASVLAPPQENNDTLNTTASNKTNFFISFKF